VEHSEHIRALIHLEAPSTQGYSRELKLTTRLHRRQRSKSKRGGIGESDFQLGWNLASSPCAQDRARDHA
jgi:hypothetical protein